VPVDLKRRIFVKAPRYGATAGGVAATLRGWRDRGPDGELCDAAFDAAPVAQLAVDRAGRVVAINERARALFQFGVADLGRPLQDLEVSYRPFELRSLIDQALSEGRPAVQGEVPWRAPGGDLRWLDIRVAPLLAMQELGATAPPAGLGVNATFAEVTRHKQLSHQVQEAQAELEAAYQELQSTNEELETTNEELHSTVEELETMNEELQSTNEELQTINDELRQRGEELNRLNAFLESVFASLRAGVVMLDRDLRVLYWSNRAEDQWGLRTDEVIGTSFFDIGLPVDRLMNAVRACLAGLAVRRDVVVLATNRRGRTVECRVAVRTLVAQGGGRPHGVLVLIEESVGDAPPVGEIAGAEGRDEEAGAAEAPGAAAPEGKGLTPA